MSEEKTANLSYSSLLCKIEQPLGRIKGLIPRISVSCIPNIRVFSSLLSGMIGRKERNGKSRLVWGIKGESALRRNRVVFLRVVFPPFLLGWIKGE